MKKILIFLSWVFSLKAMLATVALSFLLIYLSTFYRQVELAWTTAGIFTPEQARDLKLETEVWGGWPYVIFPYKPFLLPDVYSSGPDRIIQTLFANFFFFLRFFVSVVPNFLFWGSTSFLVVAAARIFISVSVGKRGL